MVKVFNQVLCLIQKTRRSKPKIVHVDKLCHTRRLVDTAWVFTLPKKMVEKVPGEIYEGLSKLFEESSQDVQESPTVGTASQGPTMSRTDSQSVDSSQKQTRSGKVYLIQ